MCTRPPSVHTSVVPRVPSRWMLAGPRRSATRRLPPAPSTVADVPAALDPVILCALAPRPDDRWPGVDAFLAALDRAHSGDPTAVTELHDPPTAARRPRALVTALLAVVVLAAAFALSYVVTGQVR